MKTVPYQELLNELLAERSVIENSWVRKDQRLAVVSQNLEKLYKVRATFISISNLTQNKIKTYLETASNHAITAVFPNRDFRFSAEFGSSRGRTECSLLLYEGSNQYELKGDMGGSILSVLGLALRVALRGAQKPRRRNTLLMDEPFQHVDKNLMEFVGRILKELSNQAKIQIIMITHEPILAQFGDVVHNVEMVNHRSVVTSEYTGEKMPVVRVRRQK